MTQALAARNSQEIALSVEQVLMTGNLASLSPTQRVEYHDAVCRSLGINPLTRPFDYLTLNNKLVLYARKDATDQLRSLRGISVRIASRERVEDLYVVTAEATDRSGRTDESIGAVSIKGLQGENLANALMKAETKAKRRVTLSIAGLGLLDESEIEDAQTTEPPTREPVRQPRRRSESTLSEQAEKIEAVAHVDTDTGEIGAPEPTWTPQHLAALMNGSDLKMSDLSPVVGASVTRANFKGVIDQWLSDNPDKSLASLCGMAAAERDGRAPVTSGYAQPEQMPFE